MTGIKAMSCQKITAAFSCLSVTCQQPWCCADKCSPIERSPGNDSEQSLLWGKERLRPALELSLHLVWQAWATWYLYLTLSFYIEASCCFPCCFGNGAWALVGTEWVPWGTGSPQDTTLGLLSSGSTTQGWRWELLSYRSWWAAIPITQTGSADVHGNLFAKGRHTLQRLLKGEGEPALGKLICEQESKDQQNTNLSWMASA